MELLRNDRDFAALARTGNQTSLANAIESIGFDAGHAVFDAIVQMADAPDDIRASFDELTGEMHASTRTALIEDSRVVRDAANSRLRSASGHGGPTTTVAYGAGGEQLAVDADHSDLAFWTQAFGSWGSFDNHGATGQLDRQQAGMMVGGDVALGQWRVGAMGGFGDAEMQVERQKATTSTQTLGLYAGTAWGKLGVRAALAQSWHDVDTRRSVIISGLTDYNRAEYSAETRQAFAEADYALVSGQKAQLQAFANVAHVRTDTDEVTENGNATALVIDEAQTAVTFTGLGLRGVQQVVLGGSASSLRASAAWRHASGDLAPLNRQAFSKGDAFTIAGGAIAEDSALIEAGMEVQFSDRTRFDRSYSGQLSGNAQDHGFNARLSISF